MASREQIIAELQRRGVQPPAPQAPQMDREAIIAELQRRGVQPPAQSAPSEEQTLDAISMLGQPTPTGPAPSKGKTLGRQAQDVGLETASGVLRALESIPNFPADIFNAVSGALGSDVRSATTRDIPVIGDITSKATAGGYVDDPTLRQIAGTAGEFIGGGLTGAAKKAAATTGDMLESTASLSGQVPASMKGRVKKAVKVGVDEGIASDIAKTGGSTRKKLRQMFITAKAGGGSATTRSRHRPSDVVGESIKDRVDKVISVNRNAGKRIDKISKALKGKAFDAGAAEEQFFNSLRDKGVTFTDGKPVFSESTLNSSDFATIKEVVRKYNLFAKDGLDAKDAHDMKRAIDDVVNYGDKTNILSRDADDIVKSLRVSLDESLDNLYPAYDKANTVYKNSIEAIDGVKNAIGKSVDIDGSMANEALGVSARRLSNNTVARANMMEALPKVETIANKYGGKFDENLTLLAEVATELESKAKAGGTTGLRGQMASAGKEAAFEAAAGSPTGGVAGFGRRLLFGGDADPEKVIDAMNEIIKGAN